MKQKNEQLFLRTYVSLMYDKLCKERGAPYTSLWQLPPSENELCISRPTSLCMNKTKRAEDQPLAREFWTFPFPHGPHDPKYWVATSLTDHERSLYSRT